MFGEVVGSSMVVPKWFLWLVRMTCCLALLVIALGSYTRLTDAGLGCPDWPGCYGQALAPHSVASVQAVVQQYPTAQISPRKAWTEMLHRYLAGSLATCVIAVALGLVFFSVWYSGARYLFMAGGVIILVIYQALLGMWTVTRQLAPIFVTQHLLGGLFLFCFLWWINLNLSGGKRSQKLGMSLTKKHAAQGEVRVHILADATKIPQHTHDNVVKHQQGRVAVVIGVLLLAVQIFLGAWTSTHYAGLSCPGLPFCNDWQTPVWDWSQFFSGTGGIGTHEVAVSLRDSAHQTIQLVHRMGAVLVMCYWMIFSMVIWRKANYRIKAGIKLGITLLIVQWILGLGNVVLQLPLWTAVPHTIIAALLLATWLTVSYYIFCE